MTTETAEHLAQARAYLERDCEVYGLPKSGRLYDSLLAYLVNPNAHDFRLAAVPALTRRPFFSERRRILDLGCGPGTLVWKALQHGQDAYGIDLSPDKIALAKAWAASLGHPAAWRERVQIADAGCLPFEDGSFDLVTSYHVLEHVCDLTSVLYEAVRVTKRGGWLELRAPDYRMSYDTHYCMPWPRFMPRAQAERWCDAMGRPAAGIGTFFYITGPQVIAILEALGCRINAVLYREHRDGRVTPFEGRLQADPIAVRSDRDVAAFANELRALEAAGALPPMYKTCLEFTIAAQRG